MNKNIIIAVLVLLAVVIGATFLMSNSSEKMESPAMEENMENMEKKEEPVVVSTPVNVNLATSATLGSILTDDKGLTLYYFTKDVTGTSSCAGECLAKWPVFYKADIKTGAGLNASDFGSIVRADGANQTTYKGWPLYYFINDKAAGDVNGEGVNKVWFVAKPDYSVMIGSKGEMNYLVDGKGVTLYYFKKDTENKSNCVDDCVPKWPVFSADKFVLPSTIKGSFGSIVGAGGKTQATFNGMPLYYFANDKSRGDLNGQGVKEVWYTVDPLQ